MAKMEKNQRKKGLRGKLINHRIRGLDKVTLNCLLSIWAMQARQLGKFNIY